MNLMNAKSGTEYIISSIQTNDEELEAFLFTLGCYSGGTVTVVSRRRNDYVVSVKDARYCIDNHIAETIEI